MPSSIKTSAAATPCSSAVLRPGARGSLLCFCHGEVIEMGGQYGWLKVYGEVDHPLADKHGGHIFLSRQDVAPGTNLTAGTIVTFHLYADSKGLGAEACQADSYVSAAAKDSWQPHLQGQVSPQLPPPAMYFVPCFTMVASPTAHSPTTTFMLSPPPTKGQPLIETAPKELPSIGSVGHADGSCKRCAFFPKGRCSNGKDCTHCHFDHSDRMRLRKRRHCRTLTRVQEMTGQLQSDEASSMHDGPCDAMEVSSSLDSSELQPFESVLNAPDNCGLKEQEPQEDDCPSVSDDDMVDVATRAPSSSGSDDDRTSARRTGAGQSHDCQTDFCTKESASEGSDSDSISLQGCVTSADSTPVTTPVTSPALQSKSCELALSPTSWSAQLRARRTDAGGSNKEESTAEIARMARALLNKLTHERFESLCAQILALPFSTPKELAVLAAEIFEKATTQNGFRSMYTELCVRLDVHLMEQSTAVGGKAFRKALVNECQATFERHLQPADPSLFVGLTGDECFEVEMKLKTRRLGNMRFIGELLVKRLLAQKLMPPIVLQLLNGDEAALESLIALLTVIAPVFEQGSSLYKAPLRDAFATLQRKKNASGISARLRCHLSDLLDARARGWAANSE